MALTPLTALSPLDGRYHSKLAALRDTFSEFALIRYRVRIEIEWLKALAASSAIKEVPPFSGPTIAQLDGTAGTIVRHPDGELVEGPPRALPKDIDRYPMPAWDLLPIADYHCLTLFKPFATMVTTRARRLRSRCSSSLRLTPYRLASRVDQASK